jgi:hypothetical protein
MGGPGSGGHNRKPADLHAVRGTFRRDRHTWPDVVAPRPLGSAPRSLSAPVKAHYSRLRAALGERGTMQDQLAVVLAAQVLAELDTLEGVTDPALVARRAGVWRRALAALRALRLTPSARSQADAPRSSPRLDLGKYTRW